jgi:HAD superfamily hydrolase (TIGR01457 family)
MLPTNFFHTLERKRCLLFDLDGTVYSGERAIPGAADFIRSATQNGKKIFFLTNRSNRSAEEVSSHLNQLGVPCEPREVITSAHVAAERIKNSDVYVIGEAGLCTALEAAGNRLREHRVQHVIVGWDRQFSFEKLTRAVRLIVGGASFYATNLDKTITVEDGILPENGPLAAAISFASGKVPKVFGKPERDMVDLVLTREGLKPEEALFIGDNLETDIVCAQRAGIQSLLMLTGVTTRTQADESPIKPDFVAENYQQLGVV